jgi:hypothetical protein
MGKDLKIKSELFEIVVKDLEIKSSGHISWEKVQVKSKIPLSTLEMILDDVHYCVAYPDEFLEEDVEIIEVRDDFEEAKEFLS